MEERRTKPKEKRKVGRRTGILKEKRIERKGRNKRELSKIGK